MSFVPPLPGNPIAPAATSSSLASLPVGKIVQSRVLQSLGDDLFRLGVAGGEVLARSKLALAPGARVDIEIVSAGEQPSVRVLGLSAQSASSAGTGISNESLSSAKTDAAVAPPSNAGPGVAGPRGTLLEQFLQLRPDLAGRVDSLLRLFDTPGGGMGEKLSALLETILPAVTTRGAGLTTALSGSIESLRDRLVAPQDFQSGGELAKVLGDKWPAWTGRLESALARLLAQEQAGVGASPGNAGAPSSPPASGGAVATPGSTNPREAQPQPSEAGKSAAPPAAQSVEGRSLPNQAGSDPTASSDPRRLVAVDLKGQLLGVKTQLQGLESAPAGGPPVARAIDQIDGLVDHLTGQQLRNLDRHGPFLHVEIPVDPRSGLTEARLRVFRRSEGEGGRHDDDARFAVALFLRMTRLGTVMAAVSGLQGATSVAFTVEDESSQLSLTRSISELRESLLAAGMESTTIQVRVRPPREDTETDPLWMDFLDREPDGAFRPQLDTKA